jgi:hypothetical protein
MRTATTRTVAGRTVVTMPAGDYWVGDPCYAVADDRWSEWCEEAYENDPGDTVVMLAGVDGWPVLGINTSYGDGVYGGSDGERYPVDAGLIGCVPVQVADWDREAHGDAPFGMQRYTFTADFDCRDEAGTIIIGDVAVYTDPSDEDYDDGGPDDWYYEQGEDL